MARAVTVTLRAMAWIECVPNISEGRNEGVIEAIVASLQTIPGVRVLHQTSDVDHNRTVLTLAGAPFAIEQAAFVCVRESNRLIDLSAHEGVHPRCGATDVLPFVPLEGTTMAQCVRAARRVAVRIQTELGLPTQLYGDACPDKTSLPDLRRQERPTGSIAVGARPPLIAFNINLDTTDVAVAQRIARKVRASSGGLPAVRALGFALASRGCVQVSMNLIDWTVTTPARALAEVAACAGAAGVAVAESELVGMIPRGAMDACAREGLRLETAAVLETATSFLDALAVDSVAPGGGSAAAHVGAVAAALVAMAAGTARRHGDSEALVKMHQEAEALRAQLTYLTDEDGRAFAKFVATKSPQDLERATEIPIEIAEACARVEALTARVMKHAPGPVKVDLKGAEPFAAAARNQAIETVQANLGPIQAGEFKENAVRRLKALENK